MERQSVGAAQGQLGAAEDEGIAQGVGAGRSEEGAGRADGEGAGADGTAGEGGHQAGGAVSSGDIGTAADGETARVHGDAAAEEAGARKLKQAVTRLGDTHGRVIGGTADRRRDVQGRRGVGDGGVAVDRHRTDVESPGRSAEVEGGEAARAGDGGAGARDDGN